MTVRFHSVDLRSLISDIVDVGMQMKDGLCACICIVLGGEHMEIETKREEAITEKEDGIRTRRVGSVTFGLTLICFGIMFLIHIVVPAFHYYIIFRLWPIVFIFLGIEILVENCRSNRAGYKFIYDFPAVVMLVLMLFFAMMLAAVDYAMMHGGIWL